MRVAGRVAWIVVIACFLAAAMLPAIWPYASAFLSRPFPSNSEPFPPRSKTEAGPANAASDRAHRFELLENSLAVGSLTTLLTMLWGLPVAFALMSARSRLQAVLAVASMVPLIIPPFISAVAWIEILNQGGAPPSPRTGCWRPSAGRLEPRR